MSLMGTYSKYFDLPVCDKFIPSVVDGQHCYKLDLDQFIDDVAIEKGSTNGLTLLMDYNNEKMMR